MCLGCVLRQEESRREGIIEMNKTGQFPKVTKGHYFKEDTYYQLYHDIIRARSVTLHKLRIGQGFVNKDITERWI